MYDSVEGDNAGQTKYQIMAFLQYWTHFCWHYFYMGWLTLEYLLPIPVLDIILITQNLSYFYERYIF